MSFLTPLYIAGALAVALPVLFHLIRRTPKGEIPFSSLMFLSPSPPRITRRSRIEHWLLLLLRGLALVLLAMAFARPFWRQPAQASDADASQERVAIVIDSSASMRRGDLWQQAVAAVDAAVASCRPGDQIGVYACDETLRPVATFDELGQIPAPQRRGVVADRLRALEPTWAGTHLGQGLLDAVVLVSDSQDSTEEAGRAARRIVLVSDMQTGGRLNVLGDAAWPADVQLELKRVAVEDPTNAGLWRLADDSNADALTPSNGEPASAGGRATNDLRAASRQHELRIRIANAADSQTEQFELTWTDANGKPVDSPTPAYVPAGESRIVRVAPSSTTTDSPQLTLTGDAQDFDNTLYVVQEDRRQLTVAYLGADKADDPQGLRYYVERAVTSDPARDVEVADYTDLAEFTTNGEPASAGGSPPLVVVTAAPTPDQTAALRRYATNGGTVLYALIDAESGAGLATLLDVDSLSVEEAEVRDYTMLGEIDFSHPMFAAMAGPQYNDFTQIRFWHYRRVDLSAVEDVHIAARFENRDPAVIEQRLGAGRIVVLTTGWQPHDGQLARSWKFLLMLRALVNDGGAARGFRTDYLVNERVTLPDRAELAKRLTITTPEGAEVTIASDASAFDAASQPGVYALSGAKGPIRFAVNINPAESDTTPAPAETFEQLGCRLVGRASAAQDAERLQQLRDVELEGRQRMWQWLVAAALGTLVIETWLAGRLSRRMEPTMAVA